VKQIKGKVKRLPCLYILDHDASKIIETDASDYGYGGILKQRKDSKEQLVRLLREPGMMLRKIILQSKRRYWQS
jgi:chromosome condensin MukBEF MukE localization factor